MLMSPMRWVWIGFAACWLGFCIVYVACDLTYTKTVVGQGRGIVNAGFPALRTNLSSPYGLVVDQYNNIFVSDMSAHVVLRVDANSSIVSTYAGVLRTYSVRGDEQAATNAGLYSPMGLWMSTDQELYIADTTNARIRRVSSAGTITTVVGSGRRGCTLFPYVMEGPASAVSISVITGMTGDSLGSIYFTDSLFGVIRRLSVDGQVSVIAGNGGFSYSSDGTNAMDASMMPVLGQFDSQGRLTFIDKSNGNYHIRLLTDSNTLLTVVSSSQLFMITMSTVTLNSFFIDEMDNVYCAGSTGNIFFYNAVTQSVSLLVHLSVVPQFIAPGVNGSFYFASGTTSIGIVFRNLSVIQSAMVIPSSVSSLAVDSRSRILVSSASPCLIRTADRQTGVVEILAGTGSCDVFDGDNVAASRASFGAPGPMFVDSVGSLYFADATNFRILKIQSGNMSTAAGSCLIGAASLSTTSDYVSITATVARLTRPTAVMGDSVGNIFIADSNRIRKLSGGMVIAIAGSVMASPLTSSATSTTFRSLIGMWVTSDGWIYTTESNRIRKISPAGMVYNLAGGVFGFSGDNGPATAAAIGSALRGIGVASDGSVYFCDTINHRIRRISADSNIISTVAGMGVRGYPGSVLAAPGRFANASSVDSTSNILAVGSDLLFGLSSKLLSLNLLSGRYDRSLGGVATTTVTSGIAYNASSYRYQSISGMALDSNGSLYISDQNSILRVDLESNSLFLCAGSGASGFNGNGISATSANLFYPSMLWISSVGDVYFAESTVPQIRVINSSSSQRLVTVLVGAYAEKPENQLILGRISGLFGDSVANLYYSVSSIHSIYRISPQGAVTLFAGNGVAGYSSFSEGMDPTASSLNYPARLWVDRLGNVIVVDSYNHRIRRISVSTNTIQTIAGTGACMLDDGGGVATMASLCMPAYITGDSLGNIYIGDSLNYRIRKLMPQDSNRYSMSTIAGYGIVGASGIGIDNVLASESFLNSPTALTVKNGQILIADTLNGKVRALYDVSYPTSQPTSSPTNPTSQPTSQPTGIPSSQPLSRPTSVPQSLPTSEPSSIPTIQPTVQPTCGPSSKPSMIPLASPTTEPSSLPSSQPTVQPTCRPSSKPSMIPLACPSHSPLARPTATPSSQPTAAPTVHTASPSRSPSVLPSCRPSTPSTPLADTVSPSSATTVFPSMMPTLQSSHSPSVVSSSQPSTQSTLALADTSFPSSLPIALPSIEPTANPSRSPSVASSSQPSIQSTPLANTVSPSSATTVFPSVMPTLQSSHSPSVLPSSQPSTQSTLSLADTCFPSSLPTALPPTQPTTHPTDLPVASPSPSWPTDVPTQTFSEMPTASVTSNSSNVIAVMISYDVAQELVNVYISTKWPSMICYYELQLSHLSAPSHDALKSNGSVTVPSDIGNVTLHIDGLVPATNYALYVLAESVDGSESHVRVLPFRSTCCRQIALRTSSHHLDANNYIAEFLTIFIKDLPDQPVLLRLLLRNGNGSVCSNCLAPYALQIPSSQSMQSFQQVLSLEPLAAGNYSIEIVAGNGSLWDSYRVEDTRFSVRSESTQAVAPRLITARYTADGKSLDIHFDRPTNYGGLQPLPFVCSKLFVFACANETSCRWNTSRSVAAEVPRRTECAPPATLLTVRRYVRITSACFLSAEACATWPELNVSAGSVTILSPSPPLVPTVTIATLSTVSACAGLIVDLSTSSGNAGRSWVNVSFAVDSQPLANHSDMRQYWAEQFRISPRVVIPARFLTANTSLTLRATLCNQFGNCGTGSRQVLIRSQNDSAFSVTVVGAEAEVDVAQWLTLKAVAQQSLCSNALALSYSWQCYALLGNGTFSHVPAISSSSRDPTKFLVAPYALRPASVYSVVISVTASDGSTARSAVSVVTKSGSIRVVLDDNVAKVRMLRSGQALVLNASKSYDENHRGSAPLIFSWQCRETYPSAQGACNESIVWTSLDRNSSLRVVARAVQQTRNIQFVLTVQNALFESRSAFVDIALTVVPPSAAVVTLYSSQYSSKYTINVDQQLVLGSTVSLSSNERWNATWSLAGYTRHSLGEMVSTPLTASRLATSGNRKLSFPLVVNANSLSSGPAYTFTLTVGSETSMSTTTSASITVQVNQPPLFGQFSVIPSQGRELLDSFSMTSWQWEDDDIPLTYQFGYLSSSSAFVSIQSRSELPTASTVLAGDGQQQYAPRTCVVHVFDLYLASNDASFAVLVESRALVSADAAQVVVSLLGPLATLETLQTADADHVQKSVAFGATLLNRANCSLAPDCSSLHRGRCESTAHTCGSCLSNYFGDYGHSNTPCVTSVNVTQSSSTLMKSCPAACSGNGNCAFVSLKSKRRVDTCVLGNFDCVAQCECKSGYSGKSCEQSASEFAQRVQLRSQLLNVTFSLFDKQDSVDGVLGALATMNEVASRSDEISSDSARQLLSFAKRSLALISSDRSTVGSVSTTSSLVAVADAVLDSVDASANALASTLSAQMSSNDVQSIVGMLLLTSESLSSFHVQGQASESYTRSNFRMVTDAIDLSMQSSRRLLTRSLQGMPSDCALHPIDVPASVVDYSTSSADSHRFHLPICSVNESSIGYGMFMLAAQSSDDNTSDSNVFGLYLSSPPCAADSTDCSLVAEIPRFETVPSSRRLQNADAESHWVECGAGEVSVRTVYCASDSQYSAACNGTRMSLRIDCPTATSTPYCSMTDHQTGQQQNCSLDTFTTQTTVCNCSMAELSFSSQSTLSLSLRSMLSTTVGTFVATIFSAQNLTLSSVARSWASLTLLSAIAIVFALMIILGQQWDATASKPTHGQNIVRRTSFVHKAVQRLPSRISFLSSRGPELAKTMKNAKSANIGTTNLSFLNFAEESLPNVLRKGNVWEKCGHELQRHHRWAGVWFHYSERFPRSLRVLLLGTNIVAMLFVQSLTYSLTNSDDGSCEALATPSSCASLQSDLSGGSAKCYWLSTPSHGQSSGCHFVQPENSLTLVIFVAILSSVVSIPIAFSVQWLIKTVLTVPTISVTSSRRQRALVAAEAAAAKPVGSDCVSDSKDSNGAPEFTAVIPQHTAVARTALRIDRRQASELSALQSDLLRYRERLTDCNEFDAAWGLDARGLFDQKASSSWWSAAKYLMCNMETISTVTIVESTLRNVNSSVFLEDAAFVRSALTEREKNKRLLYLFQLDLLPGLAGKMLELHRKRADESACGVSRSAKMLGWMFIITSNAAMLTYLLLFAISQDAHRQKAWTNSFLTWLLVEIFVISSATVLAIHVVMPLLFMKDIQKVKARLWESLQTYRQDVRGHPSQTNLAFNAASYLYVSWKVASRHSHLKIAKFILQYQTPWPNQSLSRVENLSGDYDAKFASLYSSLATVVTFLMTYFLQSPQALQDLVIDMLFTTVIGFIVLWHSWLYNISPVLVAVPSVLLFAVVFVIFQSRRPMSASSVTPIEGANASDVKSATLNRPLPPIHSPKDVAQSAESKEDDVVHVDRRRSLLLGIDLAKQAMQELCDDPSESFSLPSSSATSQSFASVEFPSDCQSNVASSHPASDCVHKQSAISTDLGLVSADMPSLDPSLYSNTDTGRETISSESFDSVSN